MGSAEIDTPLLPEPMPGSIYLAKQNDNPFGSLLAIYIVVKEQGVTIKIAGKIDPDPNTGQVTATFDNNPQLPFSDFKLDFFGGPGGVLVNPNDCGAKTYTSSVGTWSGKRRTPSTSF